MRLTFLATALLLHGCTALGAGLAADMNRERRADATTTRADFATRPPVPGDTLMVRLHSGDALVGALVAFTADTLRLDAGTVAFADVDRVERPWKRTNVGRIATVGAVLDVAWVAFLVYAYSNLSIPISIEL
ncbi:MAG TPA: hypothetical protein VGB53_04400 [Rubricoccaceae bacterium]|jgi:hypothetical protein